MTEFNPHTTETAPEGSRELLAKVRGNYGFVPNLLAVQAESPTLLQAYLAIGKIFGEGGLDATEQQVVLMTASRLNGCDYCMAAHSTVSRGTGVPADVVDALRNGTPIADAKLEALRRFTERMVENRGHAGEGDIETLLAAGYEKATVFEVIVGIAMKVLSNYTNHVADTPLDPAFVAERWGEMAVAA